MPITTSRVASKSLAVRDAFTAIGRSATTAMPRTPGPQAKLAWEYWASSLLGQLAEARREKAKAAAVAGGVLPNHSVEPLAIGTVGVVYEGTLVTIGVKVVPQADRVDVPGLVADLAAAGVESRLLKKLVKRHTKTFAGAHTFTAALVAETGHADGARDA